MCAKRYTEDLTELGMSLQTIRRNVAGAQNNLGALTVYLNALDGTAPDNIDDIAQLKKIL
jgi:phosphotransacetylase